MNSSNRSSSDSSPPGDSRFVCRMVRHWCELVERRNVRHVASCPDCQNYFRAANSLEHQLRRDAGRAPRADVFPDALERRIVQAVRQSASRPAPARWREWGGTWGVGGLAAAAVVVAMIVLVRGPQSGTGDEIARSNTADDAAVILETVGSISTGLADSVIPSAGMLVAQNPLQQELGSVYSDVRSALDFLALNFLPSANQKPATPARTI